MPTFDEARQSMIDRMSQQEKEGKERILQEAQSNAAKKQREWELAKTLFDRSGVVSLMNRIHSQVLGGKGRLLVNDRPGITYIYSYTIRNLLHYCLDPVAWIQWRNDLASTSAPRPFRTTAAQINCHYFLSVACNQRMSIFRHPCFIEYKRISYLPEKILYSQMPILELKDSLSGPQEGTRFRERYGGAYDSFAAITSSSEMGSIAGELERRLGALIGYDESKGLLPGRIESKVVQLFDFFHGDDGGMSEGWEVVPKSGSNLEKGIFY